MVGHRNYYFGIFSKFLIRGLLSIWVLGGGGFTKIPEGRTFYLTFGVNLKKLEKGLSQHEKLHNYVPS